MATGKRYYWIKLKASFLTSDAVDFLMGQPDGANYVVLYQMLCLKTINTDGKLERQIGEIIIPYDEGKIQRDCKWFSIDTVRVALTLYRQLGLIYRDENGSLRLADYENLVGSETDYADQKRRQNLRKAAEKALPAPPGNKKACVETGVEIVHTEIEYRDRDRDRDKSIEKGLYYSKDKIGGGDNKKGISRFDETGSGDSPAFAPPADFEKQFAKRLISAWNETGCPKVKAFLFTSVRGGNYLTLLRAYGGETVLAAVEKVQASEFLRGGNNRGWVATFDWFLRPDNFSKVLEGNYDEQFSPGAGGDGGLPERTDGPGKEKAGGARIGAEPTERERREHRQRAAREHFPEIRGADLDGSR